MTANSSISELAQSCRKWGRMLVPVMLSTALLPIGASSPAWSKEGNRLAFVVGIDEYDDLGPDQKKLTRAVKDASDVADALHDLGFDIVAGVGKNLGHDEFMAKWKNFIDQITPGNNDTVAIFISGHGISMEGDNYILPRNAPFKRFGRQKEMESASISVRERLLDLEERRPRLVFMILDACRTNPFIPPEYQVAGLGGVSPIGDGVLVMYSAGGHETALDRLPSIPEDRDPNSVFTRVLLPMLHSLKSHQIPLYMDFTQQLARKVRALAANAGYKQNPKAYAGLEEGFCLLGDCGRGEAVEVAAAHIETPCQIWQRLKHSTNESALLEFIGKYRGSDCQKAAEEQLDKVTRQKSVLYLITIGVNSMVDPHLPKLKYSATDASAVARTLRELMGPLYKRVELFTLTNATRLQIWEAFDRIDAMARPSDTVIVYLSGYAVDLDGHPYFIPADGKVDDPRTYVDLARLQNALVESFGRRILMVDSCGVVMTGGLRTGLIDDPQEGQVTVFAATGPNGVAYEEDRLGHSVFTYALLQGLAGKAQPQNSSVITIGDLGLYLNNTIRRLTGGRQNPFFKTDDPQFVLIRPQ